MPLAERFECHESSTDDPCGETASIICLALTAASADFSNCSQRFAWCGVAHLAVTSSAKASRHRSSARLSSHRRTSPVVNGQIHCEVPAAESVSLVGWSYRADLSGHCRGRTVYAPLVAAL